VKNPPAYRVESVDHALHLAVLLQQEGPLRVTDAARRLGVAPSTAHRLLATLVHRDFAVQDDDRRYLAGPVLRHGGLPAASVTGLRRAAMPHLRALAALTEETANLVVVVGDQVRFVATVECEQILRVGDREGRVLPAHRASGGRAVLAGRTPAQLRDLYDRPGSPVTDLPALLRDLRRVRRQGFAVNDGATEPGITAIGSAVPDAPPAAVPDAQPAAVPDALPAAVSDALPAAVSDALPAAVPTSLPAAVSLAMPSVRYHRDRLAGWAELLRTTAERITRDRG